MFFIDKIDTWTSTFILSAFLPLLTRSSSTRRSCAPPRAFTFTLYGYAWACFGGSVRAKLFLFSLWLLPLMPGLLGLLFTRLILAVIAHFFLLYYCSNISINCLSSTGVAFSNILLWSWSNARIEFTDLFSILLLVIYTGIPHFLIRLVLGCRKSLAPA